MRRSPRTKAAAGGRWSRAWIVVSLLSILAALEILAQTAFPYRGGVPFGRVFRDPEVLRRDQAGFWSFRAGEEAVDRKSGVRYRLNNMGLRGPPVHRGRRIRGVRILVVGDSTVFGLYSELTFCDVLWGMLTERLGEDQVEVINAGVPGYSSQQVLFQLERLLPVLQPDILLFCAGWNDASPALVPGRTDREIIQEGERGAARIRDAMGHLGIFRAGVGLLRRLEQGEKLGARAIAAAEDGAWARKLARSCTAAVTRDHDPFRATLAELERGGGKTTLRVPPSQYRENVRKLHVLCTKFGARVVFTPVSVPAPYVDVLRAERGALGIPLIETETALWSAFRYGLLSPSAAPKGGEMRLDRELFVDVQRPSRKGHVTIGRFLARGLIEAGVVEPEAESPEGRS
jgi:lysophospholipase L1-like esterase